MKAITIKQPWASLIVEGTKDVENRSWKCPEKYIGQRVLIHAGMTNVRKDWMYKQPIRKYWEDLASLAGISNNEMRDAMCKTYPQILGAIIGSVQIVDCVINHKSIWAEKTIDCNSGCPDIEKCPIGECPHKIYNWVLENPTKFDTPIPCKGKLRFWEYENIKNINFK